MKEKFFKQLKPFENLLKNLIGCKLEDLKVEDTAILALKLSNSNDTKNRKYNIFMDKGVFDETTNFLEIVKPKVYIEEDDCGVELVGLNDIEEENILYLYELLIEKSYYATHDIFNYAKYNEKTHRVSFIDNIEYIRPIYKEASKDKKELFFSNVYKLLKIKAYIDFDFYNPAYDKLFKNTRTKEKILQFLYKEFTISKSNAYKCCLLYNLSIDKMCKDSECVSWSYNDNLHLNDSQYLFFESFKQLSHNIFMKGGTRLSTDSNGKLKISRNNYGIQIQFMPTEMYNLLYNINKYKLKNYILKHKTELLYYICWFQDSKEFILNFYYSILYDKLSLLDIKVCEDGLYIVA